MAEHTAMVERVAAAITAAFEKEGRVFDDGQAEALARAAIAVMREPTPAMGNEFMNGYVDWETDATEGDEWYGDFAKFSTSWEAAIDAILVSHEGAGNG